MVVALHRLQPEISDAAITILAEASINQEVAVLITGFEIGGRLRGGPLIDVVRYQTWRIPAAKRARKLRLEVKGSTGRDDAFDLRNLISKHAHEQKCCCRRTLSGRNRAIRTVIHPP